MRVFPFDNEIATSINRDYLGQKHNPEDQNQNLEYYNDDIMNPFFENMLGFKLQDIKETIPYVAKFFAL